MKNQKQITIFEGQKIRRVWDEKKEKWYFSVIDIIAVLIDQKDFQTARNYWKVLKNRLNKEYKKMFKQNFSNVKFYNFTNYYNRESKKAMLYYLLLSKLPNFLVNLLPHSIVIIVEK